MEPKDREPLRVTTYNCRSVKSSIGAIQKLCNNNDIILLQEHWLLPNEINYLSNIHSDFLAVAVAQLLILVLASSLVVRMGELLFYIAKN